MRLSDAEVFSRVKVLALGTHDTDERDEELIRSVVTVWGKLGDTSANPLSEVEIRAILRPDGEPWWLSQDTRVETVDRARFATTDPESLVAGAPQMTLRRGRDGRPLDPGDRAAWHPVIWHSVALYSAAAGLQDPESAAEVILTAYSVAPDDDEVKDTLRAALRARLARLDKEDRRYLAKRLKSGKP